MADRFKLRAFRERYRLQLRISEYAVIAVRTVFCTDNRNVLRNFNAFKFRLIECITADGRQRFGKGNARKRSIFECTIANLFKLRTFRESNAGQVVARIEGHHTNFRNALRNYDRSKRSHIIECILTNRLRSFRQRNCRKLGRIHVIEYTVVICRTARTAFGSTVYQNKIIFAAFREGKLFKIRQFVERSRLNGRNRGRNNDFFNRLCIIERSGRNIRHTFGKNDFFKLHCAPLIRRAVIEGIIAERKVGNISVFVCNVVFEYDFGQFDLTAECSVPYLRNACRNGYLTRFKRRAVHQYFRCLRFFISLIQQTVDGHERFVLFVNDNFR